MRSTLLYGLLLFLICILLMEAKPVPLEKGDLEEALQELLKEEATFHNGKRKDDHWNTLKAFTEEESDPASGNGELKPEDY